MKLPPPVTKALRWWPAAVALLAAGLGAAAASRLQLHNADQLVNGFLFENYHTFHGAIFPAEHTQLLKWPLFVLPQLFHFASAIYVVLTVAAVLGTVGGLLYVLYGINRRPAAFGTLCLLLAPVLLLVPVQVFDGGVTAPLNMAMLTGRNVEYVVYLAALALLVKASRLRSWYVAGSAVLLSLLFASDRLFLYCSFGGVALLGVAAFATEHRALRRLAYAWLAAGSLGWALSLGWQAIIGRTLVHLASYSQHYEHVASLKGVRQGVAGTLQALALNFGLTTRAGPGSLAAFILNILTAGLVVYAACWTIRRLHQLRGQSAELPLALRFAALLLAASFAAVIGFSLVNQPYLQNARYLTITLFSGFVVLAVWLRSISVKRLLAAHAVPLAAAGVACVMLAAVTVIGHDSQLRAKDTLAQRDEKIASVLQKHRVEYLIGNYWRVVPIREATPEAHQAVSPLQGCTQTTTALTSNSWRPDLLTHSFAYLLTSQSLSVPQQACGERLLEWRYGPPTATVIIAGPKSAPRELLLFYDDGAAGVRRP